MSETTSENLSEVLFKPKLNIIETSTISNSSKDFDNILWGRKGRDWYRLLHYEYWSWLGLDLIEIKAALANMASSTSPRTREQCLDTVCNYGHGNWIFEFSQLGDKYSKIAKSLEEKFLSDDSSLENQEVKNDIFKNYRKAYLYYCLASYPHLKGDELADYALTQHYNFYRKAAKYANGFFFEESFSVDSKSSNKATMFIHTPDKSKPCPCVIICSNYMNLASEYLRYYNEYLYPLGIAMIAIDLPGVGLSRKFSVSSENLGVIHDAALEHIFAKVPYIDRSNIGLLAQRMGANCAVHTFINNPDKIKTMFLVGPTVDDYYVNKERLTNTPVMYRATIANRIGFDAAQWNNVIPQLQVYSLKRQGILRGFISDKKVKIIGIENDILSADSDVSLLSRLTSNTKTQKIKVNNVSDTFQNVVDLSVEWFKENLL
ncbi:MAG: alpha/beta hydrolase [Succinivibrionaceae bacterium]|nr:alpha/beta hydrolase [Succinivibrionaceae bacterium]MEE1340983.1 alpha/beta hydrolase [Succinivibrionaceae bacterium]